MRYTSLACALFICALVTPAVADGDLQATGAQTAVEEPDDAVLLTPVSQAELDQVRGALAPGGPATYAAQLASAFAACQQFLAAYRGGCTTGTLVRDPVTRLWSFIGCDG